MAADLQAALDPPLNQAKALNPLITVPVSDIQPSARTALQFARLLNEARILLQKCSPDWCDDPSDIEDFERRCREQVGPIIEAKP